MSQPLQSALQQSIRSALGCANDFNGDLHAMCDLYGIVAAPISGRLIEAARKFDSSITTASSALNYFLQNPQNACGTLVLDFTTMSTLDPRITFSRGSQATLFDSTGTLRYAKHNLLLQSQDFTTTWGNNGTTDAADGATAPDGTSTADVITETATTASHNVTQAVTPITGFTYQFSVFVKKGNGASARDFVQLGFPNAQFGSNSYANFDIVNGTVTLTGAGVSSASIVSVGNGWFRCIITDTATGSLATVAIVSLITSGTGANQESYTGTTDANIFLWGAQLNLANMEGGVTSSLTTYYPTTTAAYYAPRFDYNPSTLQPRGLLIEEQRTNSIRNSTGVGAVVGTPGTDPTNWALSPSASGVTKEIVAIGTENGIAYVDIRYSGTPSAGTNVNISFEGVNNVVASSGQTWTESVFVKLQAGAFTNTTTTLSLLGTNGTSGTESFQSATITSTPSDLRNCRLSVTGTLANAGTTHIQPRIRIGYTVGAAFDITLRIGLPQLEQGAFATSVIPTTTTALTRNADVASMTGTNFSSWYNASEGTLFAQFMRTASSNTQQGRVFSFSSGANTALIELFQTAGTNPAAQIIDTTTQAQYVPSGFTVGLPIKEILAYKLNDSNASFNGSAETPDTVCTIPTVNQAQIGNRWDGLRNLNGYVQRLAYYPTRLPNATLQALTA